jgi:hypothetical protein
VREAVEAGFAAVGARAGRADAAEGQCRDGRVEEAAVACWLVILKDGWGHTR